MSCHSFASLQVLVLSALAATSVSAADLTLVPSQIDGLEGLVEARSDEFAGVSIDEETKTVTVYHSNAGDPYRVRELVANLPRALPRSAQMDRGGGANGLRREQPWSVKMKPVARNHRVLESVLNRMNKVEPWATMVKPVLVSWEIDVEQNVVVARVRAITPALREAAARTFGSAVRLQVETESFEYYSRSNDFPSWYGGIPIRGFNDLTNRTESCTAAFSVTSFDGAITGLLTAGHCFGSGQAITQRSDGEWVGGIIQREFRNNGVDYALIAFGDGYNARVWINENTALRVNNSSLSGVLFLVAQVGTVVCFNGSATGERCNARIASLNSCVTDGRFLVTVCGIVRVESNNGGRIAAGTDSGGPVYRRTSSNPDTGVIHPDGIITAGNSAGTTAFYTPVKKIMTALNDSPDLAVFGPWSVKRATQFP